VTVILVGWSDTDARAYIDGVRVTIRRNTTRDRWLCAEHGERTHRGHCCHTQTLADTPADPERKNRR
jgi:hypothetical protein